MIIDIECRLSNPPVPIEAQQTHLSEPGTTGKKLSDFMGLAHKRSSHQTLFSQAESTYTLLNALSDTLVPNPRRRSSMGPSTVSNTWTFCWIQWFHMQGQPVRKNLRSFMTMLLATPLVTHVVSSLTSRLRSCPGQQTRRTWTPSNMCGNKTNGGVHSWHGQPTYQSDWAATNYRTSPGFCDTGKYPAPGRRHAPF